MTQAIRPNAKLSKIAFDLLKINKDQQQKNDLNPSLRRKKEWASTYTKSNIRQILLPGLRHCVVAPIKRQYMAKKKNWIAGAIKKPGALHEELDVPKGKKIPAKKLKAATKKGGKEGKRARLAETLKGFSKKKGK